MAVFDGFYRATIYSFRSFGRQSYEICSRLLTYLASEVVRFFASFKSLSSAVSEIFVRHRQIMQLVLMVFLLQQSPLSKLHCLLLTESSQIPSPFNCGSSQYSFRVLTKSKKLGYNFYVALKLFLFNLKLQI